MNTGNSRAGVPAASVMVGAVLVALAGCASVSDVTKERVTRSETAVNQAQQTLGNSEAGAVELQRAKDNLQRAKEAVNKNDDKAAAGYAQQAQLDAELSLAKAETANARKAADEMLSSIQTLRDEVSRGAAPRTPQ